MTEEELTYLEIREDRRLIELGLDPKENPLTLWGKLDDMLKEIAKEEAEFRQQKRGAKPSIPPAA